MFTNDPPRPFPKRVLYRSIQTLVFLLFKVIYRLQIRNLDNFPKTGGALICPNHLSNLDPMVVGCICPRRTSFIAKRALFSKRWFAWLLYNLECIPIDRNTMGIGGMKETLDRLKASEPVMLFPEGARSFDGELLPMMTGFTALVKRVEVPLVPVGIHGTFEAWPRGQKYPQFGKVKVVFGKPVQYSEIRDLSDREMADYLGERLKDCFEEARAWNNGRTAPKSKPVVHPRFAENGKYIENGKLVENGAPAINRSHIRNGRPTHNGEPVNAPRSASDSTVQS